MTGQSVAEWSEKGTVRYIVSVQYSVRIASSTGELSDRKHTGTVKRISQDETGQPREWGL
ncbi:MAG: hypothetical protein XXXJIFNMEKO3_00742 [Candidatus Erwinia impunctatus]|nr:hypothetical protein XXXJIFNMEKO_00742 [Culicoides impunctatus]